MLAMPGVTIRNLDDELLEWLRERATVHHRSLSAEVIDILSVSRGDEIAAAMAGPLAATVRKAKRLGVRTRCSADLLRADRERHAR